MVRSVTLSTSCAALLALASAVRADIVNLTPGVNAGPFVLSPDAGRVVFEVYEAPGGRLYSAPINAASGPVALSLPSGDNGSAFLFNSQISRDSSMIVYDRSEFPDTGWHVATYASRLDGSTPPVLLNRSKVYDDDPSQYSIAISSNGAYAAVRADQGDRVFDLLSGPTNGSAPAVMLNPGPHSEDVYSSVSHALLSAGDRAIYALPGGENPGVFSRPFDASAPALKLSPEETAVQWHATSLSRDGSKLLMPTISSSGRREVYVASPQSGQRTLLFSQDDTNQFGFVRLSNDGNRAVFTLGARQYSAPTNGLTPANEFGPYPTGLLNWQEISPDSRLIAYMTRPENHSPTELYVSPIDGSGVPKKLVGGLPEGMNFMQIAPDGNHILFFDSQNSFPNLMSVATDGSGPAVKLAKTGGFAFTPDGASLIVAVNPDLDYDMDSFYLVPLDGGPAVFLADSPYAGGGISQFTLTPDGSKVIFLADDGVHSAIFSLTVPEPAVMLTAAGALVMLTLRQRSRVSLQ